MSIEEHVKLPLIRVGRDDHTIWLESLFGLSCAKDGPLRSRGWFSLATADGPISDNDIELVSFEFNQADFTLEWKTPTGLRWQCAWTFDAVNEIWRRQDSLHNDSDQAVVITRCLSRFAFSPDVYELYNQASRWCNENQGQWQRLDHGQIILTCEGGRTTQGGTPFAGLQTRDGETGLAVHLLPMGNWEIRITNHTHMSSQHYVTLDAGLATNNLRLSLLAEESIELPALLLHGLRNGRIESNTPALHAYALESVFPQPRDIPVVYNTWFDYFEHLNVERLCQQLAAAKQIGCEVFVVDAGWYGQGKGGWAAQCGDWREKLDSAFHGQMKDFADRVRAAGLGFGLWMEPERLCSGVPAVIKHPDWFPLSESGCHYPDLDKPAARNYVRSEIARLIETYDLAWMKVDFNHRIGPDGSGAELHGYYRAWYALLDEVKREYPNTIFEGCASGGLRMDLNTLRYFAVNFLSDSVNPVDVLRIREGALLRIPPGKIGLWMALRSVGKHLPEYGKSQNEQTARVAVPCGATWNESAVVDLDFAVRIAMCGMLGLSGDLAGLSEAHRTRLAEHVVFFKTWRGCIASSKAHLLTPPGPIEDHTGWTAIQLQSHKDDTSLVFVYRLNDMANQRRFSVKSLSPEKSYTVCDVDRNSSVVNRTGEQLMREGIEVNLPAPNRATIFEIR